MKSRLEFHRCMNARYTTQQKMMIWQKMNSSVSSLHVPMGLALDDMLDQLKREGPTMLERIFA